MPTFPAHFHSVSTEIPSVVQQHFDFENSNYKSKLLSILHRSTQMPFLLNLEILLTICLSTVTSANCKEMICSVQVL